jgi:hypothetical protein
VGARNLFDILRIDINATGNNQLLFSTGQVQKSGFIEITEISAVEPAIAKSFAGQFRLFVVAGRKCGSAADDFTDFTGPQVLTIVARTAG